MNVQVTKDDIAQGKRGSAHSCPTARAICRNSVGDVAVTPDYIRIGSVYYETPDEVIDFIADFDRGRPVVPFSFNFGEMSE